MTILARNDRYVSFFPKKPISKNSKFDLVIRKTII